MISKHPHKNLKVLEQVACEGPEHLEEFMAKVIGENGEGAMLKDPDSKYEHKRSDKLLKVKKFEDSEAEVLGWEYGSGRCEEMMGALRVREVKTKALFKIGSGFTDEMRKNPPKKGTIVTYKFQGVSRDGIPRFPIFLRVHPGM
jgi:DNA ligase-1